MSSVVSQQLSGIKSIDVNQLREQVRASKPFPNFCIDNFLEEDFAKEVAAAFPSYEYAVEYGKTSRSTYEQGKYQITDSTKFPAPISKLHEVLSSEEFLRQMSYVMDIPNLVADPTLAGGGLHQTSARGKLGVHIDFNFHKQLQLHRRLNILIYLNPEWNPEWGGCIELWDVDVKNCVHSFVPRFNRCVVFETNEISFHGVSAIKCPPDQVRRSYAAYYYTKEAPAHWTGEEHTTIFRARPTEYYERYFQPAIQKIGSAPRRILGKIKRTFFGS